MEMKDRIKKIIDDMHLTQQNFANLTGIAPATLSSLFNGRTQPTLKVVEAIKKGIPNINLEWLMYGVEPMYINQDEEKVQNGPSGESTVIQNPTPTLFDQPQILPVNDSPKIIDRAEVKIIDKPQRKITEIRVFYDDQTWETFVPKK